MKSDLCRHGQGAGREVLLSVHQVACINQLSCTELDVQCIVQAFQDSLQTLVIRVQLYLPREVKYEVAGSRLLDPLDQPVYVLLEVLDAI